MYTHRDGTTKDSCLVIHDLLESLCRTLANGQTVHKHFLSSVTSFILKSPGAINSSTPPCDEPTLVSCITRQLSAAPLASSTALSESSSNPLASRQRYSFIGGGIEQNTTLFLSLHEQLKASQLPDHERVALLYFLYRMSNARTDERSGNGTEDRSSQRTQVLHQGRRAAITERPNGRSVSNLSRFSQNNDFRLPVPHMVEAQPEVYSVNADTASIGTCNDLLQLTERKTDEVVRQLIYTLLGAEIKYMKKDIITGRYKLELKNSHLDEIHAGMLLRLSDIGYYYTVVKNYSEGSNRNFAPGTMCNGFMAAIREELTNYCRMVVMYREQIDRAESHNKVLLPNREPLTFARLLAWSVQPLQRLQWLALIAKECEKKTGGDLASTIYKFLENGNPKIALMVHELLKAVCKPLCAMISRWLLEGAITDDYGEFFIECVPEVGADRLWHDKYLIRSAMVPEFITHELAHKILVIGKSINFLRVVCDDNEPTYGSEELNYCVVNNADDIFSCVPDTKLHATIDNIYENTSKHVLDIVLGPHKLLGHLEALRRYLLLGQGDFINILMENLKSELDKPAKDIYSYDLSAKLETAVRCTNARNEETDVLNYLDVRLMTPCDGDVGWDILSLQYTVRGPLATILEPCMALYQMLFKPLWRMKHMEFVLSSKIWKDQKCNAKILRPMQHDLNAVLYRLHLFTSEMIHFIHQMQYYILFEVIECAWAELQDHVRQAKTLDDILRAHDDFLNTIKVGIFLDVDCCEISQHMETVYERIVQLEVWQDNFYETCFRELEERKSANLAQKDSDEDSETLVARLKRRKRFEQTVVAQQKSLENIGREYEKAVSSFLLALTSNNNHNLQLFSQRLDFNEYYKKRDQRIGENLTFHHMRYSSCGSKSMMSSRMSIN